MYSRQSVVTERKYEVAGPVRSAMCGRDVARRHRYRHDENRAARGSMHDYVRTRL